MLPGRDQRWIGDFDGPRRFSSAQTTTSRQSVKASLVTLMSMPRSPSEHSRMSSMILSDGAISPWQSCRALRSVPADPAPHQRWRLRMPRRPWAFVRLDAPNDLTPQLRDPTHFARRQEVAKVPTGERSPLPCDGLRRALCHDLTASFPAFGPEIDDPVGGLHDVEVVLDHDDGVAGVDEAMQHVQQALHVGEVQAGRRLVEDVERPPRRASRELGRELDPLRLAAGERRRGLPEVDVAETDVVQRSQLRLARGDVREEPQGLLHRHLDLDDPVAGARLAASTLHVEGEAAGGVAAQARLGDRGEQITDRREEAGVGRWIGPRRAADGRLVDVDDLVDVLDAFDAVMGAGPVLRLRDDLREPPVEDLVHQGALPRSRDARDRDEETERDAHVDVLEVVFARAPNDDRVAFCGAPPRRHRDAPPSGEVRAGQRSRLAEDVVDRAFRDDLATVLARAGADVDDPVRGADGLLVVLDDEDRVAEIAHAQERADEPRVVALMESDRRLVEDVQDAHQARADLRRESDALRLAAGERRRGAIDGEVVEADVHEEAEARADLLQHLLRDLARAPAEAALLAFERRDPFERLAHGERGDVDDAAFADRDRERLGLQTPSLADRARALAHVLLDVGTDVVGRRVAILALEPREDALPLVLVRPALAAAVLVRQLERLLGPVEHRLDRLLRQIADGRVERELEAAREAFEDRDAVLRRPARLLPRQHRALFQR